MPSMTGIRTSTASADAASGGGAPGRPRIGLLGIMQELYDEMLPGITERQAGYARDVGEALSATVDVQVAEPARNRADVEQRVAEFEAAGVDGLLVVMLTYGPGMRVARALGGTRLPVCLANIQPVPQVTDAWDMADLTYNQGVHGAQDTANAMVRAGVRFHVVTDDWQADSFREAVGRWASAARAVTAWRSLKVAVFGYGMNEMGDIKVDETALLRTLGPQVHYVAPGLLYREVQAVSRDAIDAEIAEEDERFEIDPALSTEEREDHIRMQIALEKILRERGYGAYSTHFDAIADDGRFARLPMAAASTLMARGFGFAGEGDALTAALVAAGHKLLPDAHFTEMYAMDFPTDSILMSHMGEGNWRVARTDRKPRLIKRPLGIGGLADPPTILFQYQPGPATLATVFSLGGDRFRMLVSEGEVLDTEELPSLEMPYGHFRPDTGVRACLDAWLRLGGPHHQVMHLGRHLDRWRIFCELTGIELEVI